MSAVPTEGVFVYADAEVEAVSDGGEKSVSQMKISQRKHTTDKSSESNL